MKNLSFIFLLSTISLFAQQTPQNPNTGKVIGKLFDAETSQPVEYTTVALYRLRDSSVAGGAISDGNGGFTIDKLTFGRYFARITAIGYKTKVIDSILITPQNLETDLGKISLYSSTVALQTVDVNAEKDMVTNTLDKQVINVDKNIASSGGSAVEVMQNIPSVSVDVNGSISLRGNNNVTILIDGKPSSFAGLSSGDILSQIPASSIEQIEVVTNPSVKYDPDGTSGIINIILKKNSNNGISGNISANAGTGDKYNLSANLSYKYDKVNIYGTYDGRSNQFNGTGTNERTSYINNTTSYLSQEQVFKNHMRPQNGSVGMDYFINTQNTISVLGKFRRFFLDGNNSSIDENSDSAKTILSQITRNSSLQRDGRFGEYTVTYKKTFDTKGQEFTTDVFYNQGNVTLTNQNFLLSSPLLRSLSTNSLNMVIGQSNYIHPFDNGKIEVGGKLSLRTLRLSNENYSYDTQQFQWILNPLSQNISTHNEDIYALYGTYSSSLSGLQYQIGIRGEQTQFELQTNGIKNKKDYLVIYPSLHFSYGLPANQELMLSYSRRVDRPGVRQLLPFADYSDSLNVQIGNPNLQPQFTNSFELGHSIILFERTSFNTTLFYRYTTNIIGTVTTLQNGGGTLTTFDNIAKGTSSGIEIIGNQPLAEWWRINVTFSYFNSMIEGKTATTTINTKANSWLTKFNSNMTLWEDVQFQLIGNYNSPSILGGGGGGNNFMGQSVVSQGTMKAIYSVDAALRKDFLNKSLSVNLRVSDIFNTRVFGVNTVGENFSTATERRMDTRGIFLGISYRFNNYKPQEKRDGGTEDF